MQTSIKHISIADKRIVPSKVLGGDEDLIFLGDEVKTIPKADADAIMAGCPGEFKILEQDVPEEPVDPNADPEQLALDSSGDDSGGEAGTDDSTDPSGEGTDSSKSPKTKKR